MNKIFLSFLACLSFLLIYSCKDQYDFSTDKLSDDISLSAEFAVPLVDADISVDEFLKTRDNISYLNINSDNSISIDYDYDVEQIPASTYFNGVYSGPLMAVNYNLDRQTYELGIGKEISFDEFYIAAPRATIIIKNYWDVPVKFSFTEFNYYPKENSTGIPATGAFITQPHDINRPIVPAQFAVTELVMDTSNSNIDDIVSSVPHHFSIAGVIQTASGGTFSVNPGTTDSVKLKVNVPLDVRLKNLALNDTLKFDATSNLGSDTSKLASVKLNLVFDNGFPIDINAQVYFADAQYKILDSISSTEIKVITAQVSNGIVSKSVKTTSMYNIQDKKKQAFLNASYFIIRYKFNTAGNTTGQTVKFYSNYKVKLNAGALVKLKI